MAILRTDWTDIWRKGPRLPNSTDRALVCSTAISLILPREVSCPQRSRRYVAEMLYASILRTASLAMAIFELSHTMRDKRVACESCKMCTAPPFATAYDDATSNYKNEDYSTDGNANLRCQGEWSTVRVEVVACGAGWRGCSDDDRSRTKKRTRDRSLRT
jgi:hypothetical protein